MADIGAFVELRAALAAWADSYLAAYGRMFADEAKDGGMASERPYTDEELATARQAAVDFVDGLGEAGRCVTARDLANFDAGFKRGRRTPPPATAGLLKILEAVCPSYLTDSSDIVLSFKADAIRAILTEWAQKETPGGGPGGGG